MAAGDPTSIASSYSAAMFYLITYALTSLGTFGVMLLLSRQGFEAEEIADFRGLAKRSPWYAFLMLLLMFSLAGVPPTVGFYAKLVVLQALLSEGGIAPFVGVDRCAHSLIAAFYYLRHSNTSTSTALSRSCVDSARLAPDMRSSFRSRHSDSRSRHSAAVLLQSAPAVSAPRG